QDLVLGSSTRGGTMKTHRFAASAVVVFGLALASPAESGSHYRIELASGQSYLSMDAPVRRGTIYTFHQPGGSLIGLPAELVTNIAPAETAGGTLETGARLSTRSSAPPAIVEKEVIRPLEPGETLELGPTGDGIAMPQAGASGSSSTAAAPTGVGYAGATAPYGYGGATPANRGPNGIATALSSTDLAQALVSATAANGFPQTSSPTTIGPDGLPTLAPGMPGASAPIASNGTPQTFAPPVIGPNGTPVFATAGTPGASAPVIGSNGVPILAPQGAPGAGPVVIGSNGTPVLAPAGGPGFAAPIIGSNGTPSAPALPTHH
ncbi:MAG TPA: hypothetical protein VGG65_03310, partial [Thermoanaerobaculia bacterium]